MQYFKPAKSKSKPQGPIELKVERLAHDLRGIARHQGKTVFVQGALPGETLKARLSKAQGKFLEAQTLEVIEASEARIAAPCPYFGSCGGCSVQHMEAQMQLDAKNAGVLDQLKRFAKIVPVEVVEPMPSQAYAYRSRARIAVYYARKEGELKLGFRRAQSKEVLNIDACAVLDPKLSALLKPLRELIKDLRGRDHISHLDLALSDEGASVVLRHIKPLCSEDLAALTAFAQTQLFALFMQPQGPDELQCLHSANGEEELSYGLSVDSSQAPALRLAYQPTDFTQVNRQVNQAMVNQAMDWLALEPGQKLLDLFCGLGNFSLPGVLKGANVVGIEGSQTMVDRARKNALANGLSDVEFFMADLSKDQSHQSWCQQGFDKILLDPPRTGAKEVLDWALRLGASSIVYVSCNPATLARDAALLEDKGYSMQRLQVMNMFPQTAHVESMALFIKT